MTGPDRYMAAVLVACLIAGLGAVLALYAGQLGA